MTNEFRGSERVTGNAVPAERVGRVREAAEDAHWQGESGLDEPGLSTSPREASGWTPLGLLLGLVAFAIIVGGLLLIYWGAFRFS